MAITKTKKRGEGQSAACESVTKCRVGETRQESGNIHPHHWTIPADSHDGVDVHIGGKGHVVLTQRHPFTDEAEIVLHPTEARQLNKILPVAIDAADEHRREAE